MRHPDAPQRRMVLQYPDLDSLPIWWRPRLSSLFLFLLLLQFGAIRNWNAASGSLSHFIHPHSRLTSRLPLRPPLPIL